MVKIKRDLFLIVLFPEDEARLQLGLGPKFDQTTMLHFEEGANDVICQFRNLVGYKERTIVPHALSPATVFSTSKGCFHVTFVYADQLRNLEVDCNPRHEAIKAYIDKLPDKTRIILNWHK